jgi:hypothetical protein
LGLLLGTALPANPSWCSDKENKEELRSREEGGEERKKDHVLIQGIDQIKFFIIFPPPLCIKIASFGQIGDREEKCSLALFLFVMSSVRSNTFLGLIYVELENLIYTKVVDYFSTFLTNSYLHFSVEYSGSYGFCKLTLSVLRGSLILLRRRICLQFYGRC